MAGCHSLTLRQPDKSGGYFDNLRITAVRISNRQQDSGDDQTCRYLAPADPIGRADCELIMTIETPLIDDIVSPTAIHEGHVLLVGDAHGRYIPQIFAELFGDVFGLKAEDAAILADPESDLYWETWDAVCDRCTATDSQGRAWSLYQNGDLWAATGELPEHLADY